MVDRPRAWRWVLRTRTLEFARLPRLMGIVNVTPDSFSDGGRFFEPRAAVDHALALVAQGADIIDIGGESTRPFSTPVPAEEELRRVIPIIAALAGGNGVLAHSCWCVNERYWFGEGGMAMALVGYYDVPAVLITGDNVVTQQCLDLVPEMEAVVVKTALSPYNACSWTPARAREMIRDGAQRAIERLGEIEPFKIEGPYRIGLVSGPGQIPQSPTEGEDFRDTVYAILSRNYDYDLAQEEAWPLMPGRDGVFLTRGQRKALEQQEKGGG